MTIGLKCSTLGQEGEAKGAPSVAQQTTVAVGKLDYCATASATVVYPAATEAMQPLQSRPAKKQKTKKT